MLSPSLQAAMENPGGSRSELQRDREHGRVDVPVSCHSQGADEETPEVL